MHPRRLPCRSWSNARPDSITWFAMPSGSSLASFSVLARSRAWSSTFAGSRANPPHSEDVSSFSALPRNRTSSGSFEDCHALPAHPQGLLSKRLDQDSNLDQDLRRVLCDPLHHRDIQYPDLESNLDQGLGVPCAIRYTIGMYQPEPTTGVAPASSGLQNRRLAVRPRRRAGARGFEPRTAALEAASSPRRTLLYRPSVPKNRGPLA